MRNARCDPRQMIGTSIGLSGGGLTEPASRAGLYSAQSIKLAPSPRQPPQAQPADQGPTLFQPRPGQFRRREAYRHLAVPRMRASLVSSDEARTRCLSLLRSLLFSGMSSRRTRRSRSRRSLGPRFGSRNLLCPSRRPCRGLGPALWPCRLLRSRHWLGLRPLLAHLLGPLLFYRRPVLPNGGPCRLGFRPRLDPRLGRRCARLTHSRSRARRFLHLILFSRTDPPSRRSARRLPRRGLSRGRKLGRHGPPFGRTGRR